MCEINALNTQIISFFHEIVDSFQKGREEISDQIDMIALVSPFTYPHRNCIEDFGNKYVLSIFQQHYQLNM